MNANMEQFAAARNKTRLFGVVMLIISLAVMGYVIFYGVASVPKVFFALPVLACLGLAIVIHPVSKAEMLHQYGIDQMSWGIMPMLYKILLVVGAIMSFAMLILFEV
ncbi:MAG: hypothetical protein Q4P13_06965 [Psychrobacter sp.]|nr:hypothetical protein [Psychrobacter sp.]